MTIFSRCECCGRVKCSHDAHGATGKVIEAPGLCAICRPRFYPLPPPPCVDFPRIAESYRAGVARLRGSLGQYVVVPGL